MQDLENKMLLDSYWNDEDDDLEQQRLDKYEREAAMADEMYDLLME